jgi:hypothetical protein
MEPERPAEILDPPYSCSASSRFFRIAGAAVRRLRRDLRAHLHLRRRAHHHRRRGHEHRLPADPRLYAAGGLFYFNYPGGSGLTSGAVFGRIAGTSAARAALASEASGQRSDSIVRAPDPRPEPGSSARAGKN